MRFLKNLHLTNIVEKYAEQEFYEKDCVKTVKDKILLSFTSLMPGGKKKVIDA